MPVLDDETLARIEREAKGLRVLAIEPRREDGQEAGQEAGQSAGAALRQALQAGQVIAGATL